MLWGSTWLIVQVSGPMWLIGHGVAPTLLRVKDVGLHGQRVQHMYHRDEACIV